ncbi:uncharacterized protein LOC122671763 isoform X2 [Telopea speciosissima]|uniref:uncharacterized protein LOC122671763 isoform X2 n=1 Tax=Telopea speciosissima TaxID=54955 RepID=UPI001CC3A4F8|nr:uncharacterized protein LOC122671763 isoform X2 [Telopea speciosissima]
MAIEKSPDSLPAGWIRESKERPNGRTDWLYINLKTGEKCRSKIEVSRHTKSGNLCSDMPRPNRRFSRDNKKQLVVQMEDLPEWLPTGWSMETKTRGSGTTAGKTYKCYISSTGSKFYSKGEVFRYLENGKIRGHTSEPNKRDAAIHCHLSELKKIDTATHCHSSKPNKRDPAMHCLTSEQKKRDAAMHCPTSEPNKSGVAMHSTKSASKVVVEKHTEEGLPPGWIKEVKVTKVAGRTRKDPYYIDPVTGYEFRSKKDVFRYLESGDLGKCAIRPKKRQISDMESIDGEVSAPTAAKTHKIAGNATRRCLFTGQSSISSKVVDDELVLESSSVVEKCLSLPFCSLDGETSQMISDHQEFEGINNVEGKMALAEAGFISAPAAEVFQDRQPLEKLRSAEGENSKLTSAAQEAGGLENTVDKIVCGKKGIVSSPEERHSSEKPRDADGESAELIGEALEYGGLENMEEKMLCAEKIPISAPAEAVSPEKHPSKKLHSADGNSSEPVSIAQHESEGLENMEHEIVRAENGLISAPSAEVSPEKQPSGKSLGKRKSTAQLRTISTQDGKKTLLPRRASKRLAGLEAELAPDLDMSERALRMVGRQSVNVEENPASVVNPSSHNHQASKEVDPPLEAAAEVVTTPLTSRGSVVLLDENASKEGEKPTHDKVAPEEPNRKFDR